MEFQPRKFLLAAKERIGRKDRETFPLRLERGEELKLRRDNFRPSTVARLWRTGAARIRRTWAAASFSSSWRKKPVHIGHEP
jgi:hypothetical protein